MKHLILMKQSDSEHGDMAPSIRIIASSECKETLLAKRNEFIINLWREFGIDEVEYESVDEYLNSDRVFVKQHTDKILDFTDYNDGNFYALAICDEVQTDGELMNVRVLQHGVWDDIRIGASYPIFKDNVDKEVDNVKNGYDKRLDWCGGLEKNAKEYYKRIAIVDADTLRTIVEIYNSENNG